MRAVEVEGTEAYFVEPEAEVEEMKAVEVRVVVVLVPGVSLDEEEEVDVVVVVLEGSEVGGEEDGTGLDVAPFGAWVVGPPAGVYVGVVAPVPVFGIKGD